MFKLLRGGECYSPRYIGKKDILIVGNTQYKVEDSISGYNISDLEEYDCTGKIVCPGFIDQHVHITGGGGEEGPKSRISEITHSDIISAGVCTVVGVLGVDGITRSMAGLLAKARALEEEGLTTYIYTGSYEVPTVTLTGRALSDLVLIDKVIGIGEIAIADHRSSHPTVQMLKELANDARIGGLLGGKAGVVHIHVGDGKNGLDTLFQLVEQSDFPLDMFVPTHLNRNRNLFRQAIIYGKNGGILDFTAGENSDSGLSVPEAIETVLESGLAIDKITVSSDGNGSIPSSDGNGVGRVIQLFDDIRSCIVDKKIDISTAISTVTSNVAKVLKIFPKKGTISVGSDADILILNKNEFLLDMVIAKGNIVVKR